jgi:peroxiredoxin
MEPRYQKFKDQGYKQILVIDAANIGAPTQTLCKKIQANDGNPLTFTVVYDPTQQVHATFATGVNEGNIVIDGQGQIVYKKKNANQNTVEQEILSILPPP